MVIEFPRDVSTSVTRGTFELSAAEIEREFLKPAEQDRVSEKRARRHSANIYRFSGDQ